MLIHSSPHPLAPSLQVITVVTESVAYCRQHIHDICAKFEHLLQGEYALSTTSSSGLSNQSKMFVDLLDCCQDRLLVLLVRRGARYLGTLLSAVCSTGLGDDGGGMVRTSEGRSSEGGMDRKGHKRLRYELREARDEIVKVRCLLNNNTAAQ
jgi:hypothetical protein